MASSFRNARVENLLIQYEQLKQSQQEIVEALRDELASALTETDRATTELKATQDDLNATRSSLRSKQCEISNLSLQVLRLERDLGDLRHKSNDAVATGQQRGTEKQPYKPESVNPPTSQVNTADQIPPRPSKRTRLSSVENRNVALPVPTEGSERQTSSDRPKDVKSQKLHSFIVGEGRPLLCLPYKQNHPSSTPEKDLPHVLWIERNNQWSWINFTGLQSAEIAFVDCFLKMVNINIPRRLQWAKFTKDLGSYEFVRSKMCIGAQFRKRVCTWVQADGDQQWACDLCIQRRRPCVRFIKPSPNEDYAAAWCPLPPGERKGKQPEELRFWRL